MQSSIQASISPPGHPLSGVWAGPGPLLGGALHVAEAALGHP